MNSDAWRRQFPTGSLLDVVDAVADLVAARCADKVAERLGERPAVEKVGLSLREAAVYLGCSTSHVHKMVGEGLIRSARLGDRVIIHRAELDRLMLGEELAS